MPNEGLLSPIIDARKQPPAYWRYECARLAHDGIAIFRTMMIGVLNGETEQMQRQVLRANALFGKMREQLRVQPNEIAQQSQAASGRLMPVEEELLQQTESGAEHAEAARKFTEAFTELLAHAAAFYEPLVKIVQQHALRRTPATVTQNPPNQATADTVVRASIPAADPESVALAAVGEPELAPDAQVDGAALSEPAEEAPAETIGADEPAGAVDVSMFQEVPEDAPTEETPAPPVTSPQSSLRRAKPIGKLPAASSRRPGSQ